MGYNAVTSKYSVYAGDVLGLDFNLTLIIAQAAAIISYIPVGIISSKLGRKKTILAGVFILGFAFAAASFMREGSNIWVMNTLFALAGFFLTYVGMKTLFPYAAIFVFLAFVTMLFVKHGDSKIEEKKDILEHLDVGD